MNAKSRITWNERRRILLRRLFAPFLLLLCVVGGAAAQQQSQTGDDDDRKQDRPPQARQPVERKRPSPTVKPYVPSEKVSADKTVSFPVDI